MIEIDKATFEEVVTSAASAGVQVFESMKDALDEAQKRVYYELVPEAVVEAGAESLVHEVTRYICLDAFAHAIPQLDLVLTPTGFGVVSNQNLAPASRDRVTALQVNIDHEASVAFDGILMLLLGHEDWAASPQATRNVSSVFFTAYDVRQYAAIDAYRKELLALRPKISEAERRIQDVCSPEYFEAMMDRVRRDRLSPRDETAFLAMRRAVGYFLNEMWGGFQREMDILSNFVEDNLTDFPEYANSKTYQVKHFESYENKADDSTYFFG